MKTITAMSHIVDLQYKGKLIKLYMREKLGKHQAPYVVARQEDNKEIHIRLETLETYDDTGFDSKLLKFVKKWMSENNTKLLAAWQVMKKTGKAPKLAQIRQQIKSWIRRVKELRTNKDLLMVLRLDDGDIRIVDFNRIIPKNPALEVLLNPKVFMKAEAFGSGIRWEKVDIDLEVDDILEFSKPVNLKSLL
jgi:hypothetical protein